MYKAKHGIEESNINIVINQLPAKHRCTSILCYHCKLDFDLLMRQSASRLSATSMHLTLSYVCLLGVVLDLDLQLLRCVLLRRVCSAPRMVLARRPARMRGTLLRVGVIVRGRCRPGGNCCGRAFGGRRWRCCCGGCWLELENSSGGTRLSQPNNVQVRNERPRGSSTRPCTRTLFRTRQTVQW